MKTSFLALVVLFSSACLAKENPALSDGSPSDSGNLTDALDPCPGEAVFEGEIKDLITGARIEQTVSITNTSNNKTMMAAPNGRARLCVPDDSISVLAISTSGYLPRRHVVDPRTSQSAFAAGVATPLELVRQSDLEPLLSSVGIVYDASRTLIRIDVIKFPNVEPVSNHQIVTDAINAGIFSRVGSNFEATTVTDGNGSAWIANVDSASSTVSVDIIGPASVVPIEIPTAPGGISSILVDYR